MLMPGMAMLSGMQVRPSGVPGRYEASAEFAMAGAWALLSETPRVLQVAGGACIVSGLLLTRLPGRDSVVAVE